MNTIGDHSGALTAIRRPSTDQVFIIHESTTTEQLMELYRNLRENGRPWIASEVLSITFAILIHRL